MYAKIEDGSLIAAHLHSFYDENGEIIVTPTEQELKARGYKPVRYENPEQGGTKEVLQETESEIIVSYVRDGMVE